MDPLVFTDGVRMQWRNGDMNAPATGLKCIKETGGPSAGDPQVPWFEADLKEVEALAERASNLKLHYGLCPDEIIPPEAQDPTVWSDKEVNDWFTSGE